MSANGIWVGLVGMGLLACGVPPEEIAPPDEAPPPKIEQAPPPIVATWEVVQLEARTELDSEVNVIRPDDEQGDLIVGDDGTGDLLVAFTEGSIAFQLTFAGDTPDLDDNVVTFDGDGRLDALPLDEGVNVVQDRVALQGALQCQVQPDPNDLICVADLVGRVQVIADGELELFETPIQLAMALRRL